jgi:hypothetical protein
MNTQERNRVESVIRQVRESKQEIIITLDEYPILLFRNLYHTAKNLEPDMDAEVVERGKSFKIFLK